MRREELLDLISISDAARLRNVSHQAILDLMKRGKLVHVEVGGRKFLRRSEVENYEPSKGGRPAKKATAKKAPKKDASKRRG